jgi:LysM repeat protein
MNREAVINSQYQVTDVLHQDSFQRIYLAQDLFSESKTPVYLTAFKDLEAGQPVINAFQDFSQEMKLFFDDFFLLEDAFYTVSKQCPGKPFPGFITNTILNPYEKGLIVSNYLNKLLAMEPLPMMVKYVLSSFGNICIIDRKIVCMNNILFFSPEDLAATRQEHVQRIGDFILCVYGNSLYADVKDVQEGTQPEVAAIIQRCFSGEYPDVSAVQKDFNPIFFKSRLKQDDRPSYSIHSQSLSPGDSTAEGDILTMPDHPDAPKRPFLMTRQSKLGRRGKRSLLHRKWLIAALALLLFFIGLTGISRLFNREQPDETAGSPPTAEQPETTPQEQEAPVESEVPESAEAPDPETPAEPAPPASTEPYTTYTVQSGDTLYGISQRFYGDGRRYPEIMAYNNIEDAATLLVGQVLRIPNE